MIARRWWYAAIAGAALAGALAWAFAPRPTQVEAAAVVQGRFETAVEEDGKTRLRDQYVVSAPLGGLLDRIVLREGDPVAAGAVLATIRPASAALLDERARREQQARLGAALAQERAAQAGLERAAAALRLAEHEAGRTLQLARAGYVAPSRLESEQLAALAAKKDLESAQAQRQMAHYDVAQASAALDARGAPAGAGGGAVALRAPIDGQVLRVVQASEAAVTPGAPLLEMGDPRRLEVSAELLTADALLARPGSQVRIDRWGGAPLRGRVRRTEPAAFTKISALGVEEQRVRVLIDILEPPEKTAALGVGYRVNVRILTFSAENVRKFPVSALFPLAGAGGMAVYAIEDGRARLTPVRLGGRNDREAWVTDGLATGDRVIVYPPPQVRDGANVSVRAVGRQL